MTCMLNYLTLICDNENFSDYCLYADNFNVQ